MYISGGAEFLFKRILHGVTVLIGHVVIIIRVWECIFIVNPKVLHTSAVCAFSVHWVTEKIFMLFVPAPIYCRSSRSSGQSHAN